MNSHYTHKAQAGSVNMSGAPPGLQAREPEEEKGRKTIILERSIDSMDRLVQLLQSGLVDDVDGEFEYEDAAGNLQVSFVDEYFIHLTWFSLVLFCREYLCNSPLASCLPCK